MSADTESADTDKSVSPPRAYWRSPLFWIGNGLWGCVTIAVLFVLTNSNLRKPNADVIDDSQEQSTKKMMIVHDKDGNMTFQEVSNNPSLTESTPVEVADFEFVDTEGKKVTNADLQGKPWIICFVFTQCAFTCPRVTGSMRDLQDRLKDRDFHMVTLTVDPERDTPEVLKDYGERYGADFTKWKFLSGDKTATYRLIQGSFKMPVKELVGENRKPGYEFIHSNNIMLVDDGGMVRGKFDATKDTDMSTLRREIQKRAQRIQRDGIPTLPGNSDKKASDAAKAGGVPLEKKD